MTCSIIIKFTQFYYYSFDFIVLKQIQLHEIAIACRPNLDRTHYMTFGNLERVAEEPYDRTCMSVDGTVSKAHSMRTGRTTTALA